MTGVGDAQLFFGLISRRIDGILKTSTLTTSRPVSTSNASARNEMPRCSIAVVIHTRPPATTGEDHPRPATGVFHADVLALAPLERQAALDGVALAAGPAELRPVLLRRGYGGQVLRGSARGCRAEQERSPKTIADYERRQVFVE